MQITVLQGVNLENITTTIKIECDSAPNTVLVEEIKELHPIFLEDYKVEGNTLSIQSKLPHLWKEIAVAINNYSKAEWSYDLTKSFIFQTAIKQQILSMSTIPILRAAHELGYETTQYFIEEGFTPEGVLKKYNRYYAVGVGQESETVISIASSKDSNLAKMVQQDKWLTNIVLDRLKLPIAKWQLVPNREDLKKLHDDYRKPYVIKPVGLTGGHGVTTNIDTLEQAHYAYDFATKSVESKDRKDWQKKIMIQEQVFGNDYRILVIDGKMQIATQRIPAHIIGDGESSIKKLIQKINTDPRRDISKPTHILKPIVIDDSLINYLKEQNLTIESIPQKDQKVMVRKVASMSQGGITEDYTQRVHPQIRYIVESAAKSLHAFALGVDIICKDISQPLDPENGSIIECNTMPESYLNAFPVIGDQYPDIGKVVINGLIGKKKRTNKYVYIGSSEVLFNTFLKLNTNANETYGVYRSNNILINSQIINSNVQDWKAIESLKLNASLETIILNYKSIDEVEQTGLGFDNIDLLVIEKDLEKDERFNKVQALTSSGVVNRVETI